MSNSLPLDNGLYSEAAIFSRVVESDGELSRELAEHVLKLQISEVDRRRIDDLLDRNAVGALSEQEQLELENLNHVADLISLWQSKARRALKAAQ
ncbi:MAG TPA: hypothetical protein DDZ51_06490 [Planctomycetaceae bacterium]|nr:hypothetical protein [Planctomycetaceae bacterium]